MSPEGGHTNNIVTTDKWGNIVAYTNTINFFGGSGQIAEPVRLGGGSALAVRPAP